MQLGPRPREDPREPHAAVKLCLAGDLGVGKTCLATRYIFRRHERRYLRTYRTRIYRRRLRADFGEGGPGVQVDLELWDASGNPTLFTILQDVYFHHADGVLVVCDVTRQETLRHVPFWIQSVRRVSRSSEVRILVNKGDLPRRKLRLKDLPRVARSYGAPWTVVSAATGRNVERAFSELIGDLVLRRWADLRAPSPPHVPYQPSRGSQGVYPFPEARSPSPVTR